ncbi:sarcosine oxidase, putative [Talaromyces stipitatus ATCC 10500]|uniref:Sarcosine oxidase, putative n=1 Tax=Talaromyces stipitatus (strain ATCC 10500 / CBS 375.48 / QM 6759 / NRRL 1006) TaxID=441959 RepID=B8MG60_TALSN|nr:sarcosine oxidase, putative [Talaromyces stipitatus ATCC 10500]EED15927.1 sarcosine oxidase, putative [Talaromyces stipitatus ATCC 10500]
MTVSTNSRIIIVGAGAFGTSTAYHLSQRGYKSIRVLDRHAAPSCEAASTDISKVIRSDYNEPLYCKMGIESIEAWRDWDMFKGLYHVPGWILSARSIETSKKLGVEGLEILTPQRIKEKLPLVTGKLDGWNINVWNPTAGWAKSGEALRRMLEVSERNGVEFVSGSKGYVRKLRYASDGTTCRAVITQDGTVHEADLVILAAGAWMPSLIDLQGQLTAKGHSVAHIQLTPAETKQYSTLPILDNLELGYFFPPQEDGTFKIAHSQFITNTKTDPVSGITTSIPHTFVESPTDDLPLEIEATMRRNLRQVFPELADRPFCYTRLCWDADTADRHFLITPHPTQKNLFIATAGSAHGFKFLPIIGKYIADHIEGKLDADIVHNWRWRVGEDVNTKNLAHLDPELELSDLTGWKGRREREGRLKAKF